MPGGGAKSQPTLTLTTAGFVLPTAVKYKCMISLMKFSPPRVFSDHQPTCLGGIKEQILFYATIPIVALVNELSLLLHSSAFADYASITWTSPMGERLLFCTKGNSFPHLLSSVNHGFIV